MARFFPNARISEIHGKGKLVNGRLVVAMYHPAAALHQPSLRREVEADFAQLPALIARAEKSAPAESEPPKPAQQLSLF
jgi:DNA polymerase